METKFQRRFSINVWCGIIAYILISSTILDDCLTGQNYLDFLQNGLPERLEDVSLCTWISMFFQHDRALLIIPELWCNISMTLSLIGGSDTAVPLTGHQDHQT